MYILSFSSFQVRYTTLTIDHIKLLIGHNFWMCMFTNLIFIFEKSWATYIKLWTYIYHALRQNKQNFNSYAKLSGIINQLAIKLRNFCITYTKFSTTQLSIHKLKILYLNIKNLQILYTNKLSKYLTFNLHI